jgi:benzoyl-CoA reductase/2-hydroxyglutaryl-CoA dehydratase subunit BcrC/BadD/HgdB
MVLSEFMKGNFMSKFNAAFENKKIGWFCSYVPEELIMAAGLEPVRLQGSVERIREADGYVCSNLCPYLKNLMESGLNSKMADMAGIVFVNSCDGMRRLYDLWGQYVGPKQFIYWLEVPKNQNEAAIAYFSEQLSSWAGRLENDFGVAISERRIKESIALMNEHRRVIAEIFEEQKEYPPRYAGMDLLLLLTAEVTLPKPEGTNRLKESLRDFSSTSSEYGNQPRILVMGNEIHRPTLFEMVDKAKGSIILFDTCNGLKHYADLADESGSALKSLARRYLLKPSCARMPGFEARLERLKKLINDYGIQGVIYSNIKYCDYGLFETPQVEKSMRELGLPFLLLENDYIWSDTERLRIRVEAFLETVRQEF